MLATVRIEGPEEVSTRFQGLVSRYYNHTRYISNASKWKFAIMYIHNDRITEEIVNALKFWLSSTVAGAAEMVDTTHM